MSVSLSVCLSVCPVPRLYSRTEMPKKPKIGRMEALHTSNSWTYLVVKVTRLRDASDRYWPISREQKGMKTPKLVEISRKIAHVMATRRTSFKVKDQRSKVNVTTSSNAETGSASYLSKGKAYELLTWNTDGERRPVSPTSAMTS